MTFEEFNNGRREYCPRDDYEYKWPQAFTPHHVEDAELQGATEFDRQMENWVNAPEDVLNQWDTISVQDLEEQEHEPASGFTTAGFAEETAVDTFIHMNGDTRYVTSI